MIGAAALNDRDPDIAAGMVDSNLVVDKPELGVTKTQGEIIALSSEEALKAGYADQITDTPEEAIHWLGYTTDDIFRVEHTGAEKCRNF